MYNFSRFVHTQNDPEYGSKFDDYLENHKVLIYTILAFTTILEVPTILIIFIVNYPIHQPKYSSHINTVGDLKHAPIQTQIRNLINVFFYLAMLEQLFYEFIRVVSMWCFAIDHRQTFLLWNSFQRQMDSEGAWKLAIMFYNLLMIFSTVVIVWMLEEYKNFLLPVNYVVVRRDFHNRNDSCVTLDNELRKEISAEKRSSE